MVRVQKGTVRELAQKRRESTEASTIPGSVVHSAAVDSLCRGQNTGVGTVQDGMVQEWAEYKKAWYRSGHSTGVGIVQERKYRSG